MNEDIADCRFDTRYASACRKGVNRTQAQNTLTEKPQNQRNDKLKHIGHKSEI
jgi:hypothetical protein